MEKLDNTIEKLNLKINDLTGNMEQMAQQLVNRCDNLNDLEKRLDNLLIFASES